MACAVSSYNKIKMHQESDDGASVGSNDAFNYEAYSAYSAPSTSSMGPGATASAGKKTGGSKANERALVVATNAKSVSKKAPASVSSSDSNDDDVSLQDGASGRPEHLKPRLCTVPGCKKRVRSKGLCKAHGGGRRCMVEGCERSSQGQGLCIRHGGGKRCTQQGCTKASQSNGLCKAHGGGLRCMAGNCTKSSQGGGFCRAHGGGQRCEKEGCNKGAQRGGFCAGHGGSRFCQHPDCTKNDRGGGYCAEHGGGKRCDQQACNKPARKKGKCSFHANGNKTKASKEQPTQAASAAVAAAPPPMMDMRQLTAPTAAYNAMQTMPQAPKGVDPAQLRDAMDQHAGMRSSYPPVSSYPHQQHPQQRMDVDHRYSKGYDQQMPMASNAPGPNPYLMHGADQRGYEPMAMQHQGGGGGGNAPRGQYMDSSLPSVSQGYSKQQPPHQGVSSMAGMDRSASPYEPVPRQTHQGHPMQQQPQHAGGYSQHAQQHWSKDAVSSQGRGGGSMDFYDMKEGSHHPQAYGAPPPGPPSAQQQQYHHHMSVAGDPSAAAYGSQRESYYAQQQQQAQQAPHHAPSGQAPNDSAMYGSYNYQPHQMHSMNLL